MAENELISKELYQKIKKMDRDELLSLIKKARLAGRADALREKDAIGVNLDKIRFEIGEIKGVSDALADEVISVLKKICRKGAFYG